MKHKLWLMTLLLSGALMQAGAVIEEPLSCAVPMPAA